MPINVKIANICVETKDSSHYFRNVRNVNPSIVHHFSHTANIMNSEKRELEKERDRETETKTELESKQMTIKKKRAILFHTHTQTHNQFFRTSKWLEEMQKKGDDTILETTQRTM